MILQKATSHCKQKFPYLPILIVLALNAKVSLMVDQVGDAVPLEELGRLTASLPHAYT
jgi:hypothetical protein